MRAAINAAEGAYSAAGKADAYEAAVHAAYSADCARSAGGWAAASLAPNSAKEIIEYVRGVKKEVAWQGDRLMEFWEEP